MEDTFPPIPKDPGRVVPGKGTRKDPWVILHDSDESTGWFNKDGTYQESENV